MSSGGEAYGLVESVICALLTVSIVFQACAMQVGGALGFTKAFKKMCHPEAEHMGWLSV